MSEPIFIQFVMSVYFGHSSKRFFQFLDGLAVIIEFGWIIASKSTNKILFRVREFRVEEKIEIIEVYLKLVEAISSNRSEQKIFSIYYNLLTNWYILICV